jgi:dGTPase
LRPGDRWRAPYAADSHASRGRLFAEPPSPSRNAFQRDRDRIVHSTAFRRLKHKTQVFVEHEGDHYRTRLTHTLEVAQIARSIARALGLDEDLAETLALAHDLGHTPFGHAGERALDRCLAAFGGFDHNAQSLKIVTALECRYAGFDGLNLTFETLEGLVKHNGPLTDRAGTPVGTHAKRPLAAVIRSYNKLHPLDLWSQASAEAQAAAIADDIAYNAHDIDDGLRSGVLTLDELGTLPFTAGLIAEIVAQYPALAQDRMTHELQRQIITRFVEDVIAESQRRLGALYPCNVDDIRSAPGAVIGFSPALAAQDRSIKAFLFPRLYRSRRVMDIMEAAEAKVEALFGAYISNAALLPQDWRSGWESLSQADRAGRIADYIAGMTDRFALGQYQLLFDRQPDLR